MKSVLIDIPINIMIYLSDFEPFTREETKIAHEIQGTGLGMAIAKSLVDLMGGTFQVESKLGEGSTFTVDLELRIQKREDGPQFWKNHKAVRMIVADDDEEVCRNMSKPWAKWAWKYIFSQYPNYGADPYSQKTIWWIMASVLCYKI